MWAREQYTVHSHCLEGQHCVKVQKLLGLEHCSLPSQGPYPMRDEWELKVDWGMVLRSLDEGKNPKNVQFNTVRKMHYFVSITAMQAGLVSDLHLWVKMELDHIFLTLQQNYSGLRDSCRVLRPMGDLLLPDKAVSRYFVWACFIVLKHNWEIYGIDNQSQLSIAKAACIIITRYYGSLQGDSIRKYLEEAMNHPDYPHVPMLLSVSFKGEVGIKLFCQTLAAKTKDRRNLAMWYSRYIFCI